MHRWKRDAARLHGLVGVAVGLFILVSGLTGAVMAFEPDLPGASLVSVPATGTARPLAELTEAVVARYPQYAADSVILPERNDRALIVNLLQPGQRRFLAVYVDPYTAAIVGDSEQGTDIFRLVRRLHTGAAFGGLGSVLMVLGAIGAVVLAPTGVWMWWRGRRRSVHAWVGLGAAAFLLLFGITALKPIPQSLTGSDPLASRGVQIQRVAGAVRLSADTLVQIAESALPGARAVSVGFGGSEGRAPADVYLRFEEDQTAEGRSVVFLDPYTGQVVGVTNPREMGFLARYAWQWNEEFHTGSVGGAATRRAAGVVSGVVGVLALTGLIRWRGVVARRVS